MAQALNLGDILFYQGRWDSPLDLAIMARTHSQVVHVGVVVSSVEPMTIAAQSRGIVACDAGDWKWVATPHLGDEARRPEALAWLEGQVGMPYGLADLANQLLLLAGKDPVLLDKSFDCSDLACSFLWITGEPLDAWMIEHNRVTPADLFAYFQVQGAITERTP